MRFKVNKFKNKIFVNIVKNKKFCNFFFLFRFYFFFIINSLNLNLSSFFLFVCLEPPVDSNDLLRILPTQTPTLTDFYASLDRLDCHLAVLAESKFIIMHNRLVIVGHVEQADFICIVFLKIVLLVYNNNKIIDLKLIKIMNY